MKRRLLLTLLFVLAIAGTVAGYAYYQTQTVAAQTPEEVETAQTAQVRVGDLVLSATGAGSSVAATQLDLAFQSSGIVTEILVKVGGTVEAGDVIARLDTTEAQEAVTLAEQNLLISETELAQLQTGASAEEIAAAQADLTSAQASLADLQQGTDANEVASAQASLASAEASLADLQAGPDANAMAQADATLEQAAIALQQAQAAYDQVAWKNDLAASQEALDLQAATITYNAAQSAYDASTAGATASEIASAEAQVASARASLNSLYDTTSAADVASSEAQVLTAQLALDELTGGTDASELTIAQISVEQNQIALTQAQRALEQMVLVAPVGGTVLAINADVGESSGTDAFVSLADLSQPLVEIYMDESDLDKVAVGDEAQVTFDAFPDTVVAGTVVQIDPQLVVESNVTTVHAMVKLSENPFENIASLPLGMNATVDVIAGRAEDALLVPVEALREVSPNEYAVFVQEGETLVLREVEVGLQDFTYAEITSGLSAGDVVSTGIIETN